MPRVQRAHYVLAVHDLARSARWFERVLGCACAEVDKGNWVFCTVGPVVFMLGACPDAPDPAGLGDHRYFAYLVVDDVDAFHERAAREIAALGQGEVRKAPTDEPWGMREMALATDDGRRLMVAQTLEGDSEAWPAPGT